MTTFEPAAALAAKASRPYPNDGDEYRRARTALLAATDMDTIEPFFEVVGG